MRFLPQSLVFAAALAASLVALWSVIAWGLFTLIAER